MLRSSNRPVEQGRRSNVRQLLVSYAAEPEQIYLALMTYFSGVTVAKVKLVNGEPFSGSVFEEESAPLD